MIGRDAFMIYAPRRQGQGLVEYAIIIMLIAIVLIAIVAIFGEDVSGLYSQVLSEWPSS
jgi:pilus assembly protein Flp/PilA